MHNANNKRDTRQRERYGADLDEDAGMVLGGEDGDDAQHCDGNEMPGDPRQDRAVDGEENVFEAWLRTQDHGLLCCGGAMRTDPVRQPFLSPRPAGGKPSGSGCGRVVRKRRRGGRDALPSAHCNPI